ncbi:patatin-like phospholipase family protein [Albimonas sp. CAU 1670]|uniref:patatin-like phospholipase family protein n=1 Tax=Albimonas sp. CAU 1670 TaxID=3032599 RepID=UPI0023D97BE9|nr:patatin-like phospholipase family protein [Albimonas sp. CAU 1670]MDF2233156.1 patatin-like phospholipase family protein [Albimonas sp. CAU 1670]
MSRILALLSAFALAACAPSIERDAPPLDRLAEAAIPNIPNARHWSDRTPADIDGMVEEMIAQRQASGLDRSVAALAISGGADDGAFGAGLMAAWTERGDRPEFPVVTGVSTGALSAPFVFLGPNWDDELQQIYGGFPSERTFAPRFLLNILRQASAAESAPLAALIAEYVDDAFLAEIAREHRRGRRLYVQTTHLDAQEGMIWDMGAIAASGAPNAAEVFRAVLLASASVPGAFPPVLIGVELDGLRHDEMHVDGGAISQSALLADWHADLAGRFSYSADAAPVIYVIRNGRIGPESKVVDYDLLAVGGRAAATMIKSQGVDDLLTAHEIGRLRGATVHLTWIGDDFQADYPGPFGPAYMTALQRYGRDLILEGRAWESLPPQLMTDAERQASLVHAR